MQRILNKLSVTTLLLSTCISSSTIADDRLLHAQKDNQHLNIPAIKDRINTCNELCMDKEEELKMLDELQEFELGNFLLRNRSLNGPWTSYLISEAPKKILDNQLEHWIINYAPVVKATQERNSIFQRQISKHLRINSNLASVPCGTMHDIYALNLDGVHDISMVGYDLDEESINLARENYRPNKNCSIELHQKDAWHLHENERFDVLVSNGLNIYEDNDEKVVDLYSQFYNALIPGGVLITSFLTPSPEMSYKSTWKNYIPEDVIKQKAIFKDIIDAKWQVYRTEDDTRDQLEKAGFKIVEVIYDSQGMFPTVVAKK